ncbi:helix-turn-helix transcriptional regulator [Rhodopseudomonas palustris]|uniref:AraC family transcriptional regulator n=1 Tax=Rhodopseudomonas palustris TaxID=1076 RepID=UPI002ACDE2BB|nr:helix-turn-helix transcriptional regulator [Rhodopseudomonas palustris]WQG99888.1 helix-turn-helix transcriptional regulator [Rhodopseudomonas palustris]
MPILDQQFVPADWIDPDDAPGRVVAYGMTLTGSDLELPPHRHRKAQLLLSLRGVLTCEADSGLWLVPPQHAIWIPGGAMHAIRASGPIEGYDVFVEPEMLAGMPNVCCTLSATPLLRELLVRAAGFPVLYPEGGRESHLFAAILDEIAASSVQRLFLPMPVDARLRRIVDTMISDPADRGTMGSWAKRAGMSERTLARLLARETGLSFGRWRQQLTIMVALQRMAEGASIQRLAIELGYASTASFVTMFRKTLGVSPGRYMATLRGTVASVDEERAPRPR